MQAKLIIHFSHDSDPTFLVESKDIIVSVTNNPNFPSPGRRRSGRSPS